MTSTHSPEIAAGRIAAAIVDIALETYRRVDAQRSMEEVSYGGVPARGVHHMSTILRSPAVIDLFVRGLVPTAIERARWSVSLDDWNGDDVPEMIPIMPPMYERAFTDGLLDARRAGAGDGDEGCDTEHYGLGYAVLDDSAESELTRRWYEAGWQCLIFVVEALYEQFAAAMRTMIERSVGGARKKPRRRR